ncbi:hypothetical protein [Qipengyuania oceanensis]|uniref:Lipoprotein n=1 Tax=Qipengyuania oceanensis TaxID=1463597 RepID=A0A844YHZ1_9SPHN|nr:hypothetical protein [Qipengyuania oceanensis]MXO64140.1 hypothetical protein [Qipengyuania oceanensis]
MKTIAPAFLLSLVACSTFPAAEMRLPHNLSSVEAEQIVGIDGWTHGCFKGAGYAGGYKRSERRSTYLDTFDRRAGHASFTIEGPMISSVIDGRCHMRERELQFGTVSFTTKPMAYRCEFLSDGLTCPIRVVHRLS